LGSLIALTIHPASDFCSSKLHFSFGDLLGAGAAVTGLEPGNKPGRLSHRDTLADMPELRQVPDEPPPFLGTWRRVYTAAMVYLAGIILLLYLFTRAYRQ
jgi:hypothetical protein